MKRPTKQYFFHVNLINASWSPSFWWFSILELHIGTMSQVGGPSLFHVHWESRLSKLTILEIFFIRFILDGLDD